MKKRFAINWLNQLQYPNLNPMQTSEQKTIQARTSGENTWLQFASASKLPSVPTTPFEFHVLENERAVGQAMFDELVGYAGRKNGDIVIVLLGGRGAQAMYRIIAELAKTDEIDGLLGRLHVFTQDALAPMRMDNGLSFVRDFERLLGDDFFRKIKSFTPMRTDAADPESEFISYLEKLDSLGGIDIFFLGLGPEAGAASHICYIKPGSGAKFNDLGGIIPISSSILEHHINKFKVGGSDVSDADEIECRNATHILTLGPAAILGAKKIVQSIVDASTAPAKRESFERFISTEISTDPAEREKQLDENPGLWIRIHGNATSFVLPDLLFR
jgi:6-phosphogluconolactonase/glucosamine-6-phosphate isomerase/deaminase